MMLGRRRLSAIAVPALVGACGASPDPVLYTVAVRPGPTFPAGPRVVQLRDIGLASYLDRKEIVRSSEDYKLGVMANNWWGESLGSLLGRVLVVELSQRLPNSKIYSESGAINADPNADPPVPFPGCVVNASFAAAPTVTLNALLTTTPALVLTVLPVAVSV